MQLSNLLAPFENPDLALCIISPSRQHTVIPGSYGSYQLRGLGLGHEKDAKAVSQIVGLKASASASSYLESFVAQRCQAEWDSRWRNETDGLTC